MNECKKSVLRECQKLSAFDQVEREFLMQERHDRDLKESVMLGLAFQTSCVMENLHHKSCILPDPDTFAFDIYNAVSRAGELCILQTYILSAWVVVQSCDLCIL